MAVTANWYALGLKSALSKLMNIASGGDTLKAMLCTSSYTPNLSTHQFKSDITNEVVGTGYTATGNTLTTQTITVTAANSWATSAAVSTVYAAGKIVRPATGNGFLYQAVTGGTSGGSAPTWPTTVGLNVTDGSVVWVNIGESLLQFDADDTTWATSTITARYCVIYDSTPATDATRPLICVINFGADQSSSGGPFTVQMDPLGIALLYPA